MWAHFKIHTRSDGPSVSLLESFTMLLHHASQQADVCVMHELINLCIEWFVSYKVKKYFYLNYFNIQSFKINIFTPL